MPGAWTADLSGKNAVVTGASRGIGEACVRALDAAGARVALLARSTEPMKRIAADLQHDAVTITVDLTSSDETERAVDEAIRQLGTIDIVVNNVGIMETSEAPDALTADGLDLQLDLNLRNVMLLTSRFAAALRERRGCVVNMSSVAAQISGANGLVYAATKGGMNSFTRVLATAWAPDGVRVNGIAPGYVETDIWTPVADRLGDDGGANLRKGTSAKIPMQRWGTADEIASVVVFLCSDAASYLTGQTINVDGGVAM